jgi:pyruvate-formate lyase
MGTATPLLSRGTPAAIVLTMASPSEALHSLDYGMLKDASDVVSLERELHFTSVFREHERAHPFEREIACLRVQVESTLAPIEPGDWFAGRIDRALVGIDPERGDLTEAAYFCRTSRLEALHEDAAQSPQLRADAARLIAFWKERSTYRACRDAYPPCLQEGLPSDDYYASREISYPMYGLGGPCLDYAKLARLGVDGLRRELHARQRRADASEDVVAFCRCLEDALDIFAAACRRYAAQARELAQHHEEHATRLRLVARSCAHVADEAPSTYHEAIQLVWLYSLVALPRNYGRLDVTLGGFLAHDLDSGELTRERAHEMTRGLWRLIEARGDNYNNRIVVGGRGRPDEPTADRFAMLAMQVQEELGAILPQLSLRWHRGMDRRLWDKAVDVIGRGSTFPILYNDDVNVPAVAEAFGVSEEEAEQYVPYGCGEYVLDHRSIGSPDAALNVLKALDVTLHDGIDAYSDTRRGLALGHLRDFASFADLQAAFVRQVEHQVALLAEAQAVNYRITGEHAAFPLLCLLYDDCVERGQPLLSGGVRHLGGTLESFGNNGAADSLLAIKRSVYDDKRLSAEGLLELLDGDFEGQEAERRYLQGLPKFGNDHHEADAMSIWVNEVVCRAAREQAARVGLDSFLVVLVNNGDSVLFGKRTAASADGRRAGEPVTNGNQPSAGADQSGPSALLNSMAKLDPALHAGATHNLKLSRAMFQEHRAELDGLLEGYFATGGTQLMVTVTDRRELERALEEPESYRHLIVRVGGYSERFVDLPGEIQLEVIRRTLY